MARIIDKQVRLRLVGQDGNAFALLGAFAGQARREGWTEQEIDAVCDEAMAGDYHHLLRVLMQHCVGRGVGAEDD